MSSLYVKAPKQTSIGVKFVDRVQAYKGANREYDTLELAAAALKTELDYVNLPGGGTAKLVMNRGLVGPNRFRDTDYSALYLNYSSRDNEDIVYQSGTRWASISVPLGINYSGLIDSGLPDRTECIKSSSTLIGVANGVLVANLENRIKSEARGKLSESKDSLDLAESLVGLSPTVKMVSERAIQVLKAWTAVRKGNFKRAAYVLGLRKLRNMETISKDMADLWLELQYGWKPLLDDIYNGTGIIQKVFEPRESGSKTPEVKTVTRRGRQPLLLEPFFNTTGFREMSVEEDAFATCEVKVRFRVSDSFAHAITGTQINNPLYIAWAALPFSFVVDWLVPVGDMLSSLSAPIGLDFVSSYMTTRRFASVRSVGRRHDPQGSVAIRRGSAVGTVSRLWIDRQAFTSWPTIMPYMKLPLSSPERVVSAASLIRNTQTRWRI